MTAPGLHLEFADSPGFQSRCQPVPGLAEAIREGLRRAPPAQGLQVWELRYQGADYGVVLLRRGQRISLAKIFQLPEEETLFIAAVRRLRSEFGR